MALFGHDCTSAVDLSGHIKAMSAGSAQITATTGTATASVAITVVPPAWTLLAIPAVGQPGDLSLTEIAVDPRDENTLTSGHTGL